MHYPGPGASYNGFIFSWVGGTLGSDRDALGVGVNTLGSDSGGLTGD